MRKMTYADTGWPYETDMSRHPNLVGALPINDGYFVGSHLRGWACSERRVANEAIPSFEDASKTFEHWWWDKRITVNPSDDAQIEFWEITGGAYFKVTDDGEHYHRVVL